MVRVEPAFAVKMGTSAESFPSISPLMVTFFLTPSITNPAASVMSGKALLSRMVLFRSKVIVSAPLPAPQSGQVFLIVVSIEDCFAQRAAVIIGNAI